MKDKNELLKVIGKVLDTIEDTYYKMDTQDFDLSIRKGNLEISFGKPDNQTLIAIRQQLEQEGYVVTPSSSLFVHLKA